jgi:CTD small phosphatase-like protein 2
MDSGESIEASINIRPYAITLLNQLSKNFEIIVFTASYSCYADVVLDYIDPERKIIEHRLYREHCFKTDKDMYIKDLRIINRGLHEMVLIDNASYSYIFQLENGIPIFPYYDGSNDFELKALESYLAKISTAKDVR